jgi:serine protease AprX
LPEVQRLEEYAPPVLWNNYARALLRVVNAPAGAAVTGYDGQGQIVGIADTGIDDAHPDFGSRLLHAIARGRPAATDDPHGHGTHVAGSVAGDGSADPSRAILGTAPAASIVFQSLLDANGGLGGLPLDLGDLFDEAYKLGARIHNNSWGSATDSTYTIGSNEVDEFVWKCPDMLVVIAAGNEGQEALHLNTGAGVVEWLSIGSPATAKNALTVGASRSDRCVTRVGTQTWGAAWPSDSVNPPISSQLVSGDPQALAAFSSRGPSDDRRIKPDLVAPGTDILSARSSKASSANFWDLDVNPKYAYMGGTSMATPLVSGCAALVRQYYIKGQRYDRPSAALLRATLINGTRWLNGADSIASNPPPANYDQGFGSVDMQATIPAPGSSTLVLAYVDSWTSTGLGLSASGGRLRWTVDVNAGAELRFCLAYTDYPARALQNNLNLFVQKPDGSKLVGNAGLRQSLSIPDVDNNVEIVRLTNAPPGTYLIQVTATNILHGPQEFALVVTGNLMVGRLAPL